MTKYLWTMTLAAASLTAGCVQAQTAAPAESGNASPQATAAVTDSAPSTRELAGKVGLVRGVVKRMDPIHDQLVIHAFGGGDVRIAFDPRTQFPPEKDATVRSTSIPVGTVVSVDTVMENGKLFAASVRTSTSHEAELNGQVVRYDVTRSRLIVRDPISPDQNVSLRITSGTTVVDRGKPASPEALSAGMLVRVRFSAAQHEATNVEILAARGNSFLFEGRVVAVDLRSHKLVLSNETDQSVRELAIGSLDAASLSLLHEGADVSIQAEFDGERYDIRTVTAVPPSR
jgi:predicted RNA-binding protein